MLQGVDHHLLLEGTQVVIALLQGHQSPLDHLLAQAEVLLVGQQLAEGLEIEHALPQQVVSELLSRDVALEVDDVARGPVEPPRAVVLLQDQHALRPILAQHSHDGWQDLGRLGPDHDFSMKVRGAGALRLERVLAWSGNAEIVCWQFYSILHPNRQTHV